MLYLFVPVSDMCMLHCHLRDVKVMQMKFAAYDVHAAGNHCHDNTSTCNQQQQEGKLPSVDLQLSVRWKEQPMISYNVHTVFKFRWMPVVCPCAP